MLTTMQIYVLMISIIVIVLVIFAVYIVISTRHNHKIFEDKPMGKENKSYTLQINLESNNVSFIHRKNTLVSESFTLDDFSNSLPDIQRKSWLEWIIRFQSNGLTTKDSIVLNLDKISNGLIQWIRFTFVSAIEKNIVFLKGTEISSAHLHKKRNTGELINLAGFKSKLYQMEHDVVRPCGTIFCINFNMFEIVWKRYGVEIANQYLLALWGNLNVINNEPYSILAHYIGDTFLVYVHGIITKKDMLDKIDHYSDIIDLSVDVDNYDFVGKPLVGATILGEYTTNADIAIHGAKQAMLRAKSENKPFVVYDSNLEVENKQSLQNYEELRNIVEYARFEPVFFPVISMQNGHVYGYSAEMDFSKSIIKDFKTAYNLASENEIQSDFYAAALKKWLDVFIESENSERTRLFVQCDLKYIELFYEIFTARCKTTKINLIVVISNYNDLINLTEDTKAKMIAMKPFLSFGVNANESMQTSIHPILEHFSYLILPTRMTKAIVEDQRTRMVVSNIVELVQKFNMDTVGWNISNYSQAEILKTINVDYMNGPLFDQRDNNKISVRKISRLIDENIDN